MMAVQMYSCMRRVTRVTRDVSSDMHHQICIIRDISLQYYRKYRQQKYRKQSPGTRLGFF